jgi:hypothetical protein
MTWDVAWKGVDMVQGLGIKSSRERGFNEHDAEPSGPIRAWNTPTS